MKMAICWDHSQTILSAIPLAALAIFLHVLPASAQDQSGGNPAQQPGQSSSSRESQMAAIEQLQYFINGDALPQRRSMLIAHAVIACIVWGFLIPLGGMLLHMKVKAPWVIRVHAILQVVSFSLFVAAVGLGIFLINTLGPYSSLAWQDAHPRLGLSVLALASIQPFLGIVHHRLFKRRLMEFRQSGGNRAPGGTIWGQIHLWLGRLLIVLGIINGGLGIRLAEKSPTWLMPPHPPIKVAYSISVSLTVLIYMVMVFLSNRRRSRDDERNLVVDGGEETSHSQEQKMMNTSTHATMHGSE